MELFFLIFFVLPIVMFFVVVWRFFGWLFNTRAHRRRRMIKYAREDLEYTMMARHYLWKHRRF